jgi:hypothetical protein
MVELQLINTRGKSCYIFLLFCSSFIVQGRVKKTINLINEEVETLPLNKSS